jgi:hypothetical protein
LNKNAGRTLTADDLSIIRNSDGAVVSWDSQFVAFEYDPNNYEAQWVFDAQAFGQVKLPDGEYHIVIKGAGLQDEGGSSFDLGGKGLAGSDLVYTFVLKHGDIDGDGRLSPADLGKLRALIKAHGYGSAFDFNNDKVLDSRDVDFFNAAYLAEQAEIFPQVQKVVAVGAGGVTTAIPLPQMQQLPAAQSAQLNLKTVQDDGKNFPIPPSARPAWLSPFADFNRHAASPLQFLDARDNQAAEHSHNRPDASGLDDLSKLRRRVSLPIRQIPPRQP